MRTVLKRVAAVATGATLACLALPAAPAAAATSASCPAIGSTRLFTGSILGSPDNRLWVYSPTPTQTIVCFDFPFMGIGGGAIVVNSATGLTLPTVTPGTDPAACTTEIVDIVDPVRFRLATGFSGTTICFTLNNSTTSVAVGMPSIRTLPSVEVWRDGTWSLIDVAACIHLWALTPEEYYSCVNTNQRIV